jgi:poly(beta-D-mannuronate) lyase
MRRLVLSLILSLAPDLCAGAGRAATLAAPFPPSGPPAASCTAPPAPIRDLDIAGFYTDPAASRPDPARLAADATAARPLQAFLRSVQRPVAPNCALAALDAWASADALLGSISHQAAYHRDWTLAGAALAFLELRDAPGLDPAALQRVRDWLGALARAVQPHYQRTTQLGPISDVRNNHAYWAGLAVAATGIANDDRGLLAWGVGEAAMGLRQVTPEGALPLELARRRLALHYHFFALEPLAALAWLAAANEMPIDTAALGRLARFCFAGAADPARVAALAGEAQDDPFVHGRPPLAEGAGLAIWLALTPDPAVAAGIAPFRPYRDPWLGGDVGRLWRLPRR